MRVRWLAYGAMLVLLGTGRVSAVTCEAASADYVTAMISNARFCLTRLAPHGRACNSRNRGPNLKSHKVDDLCPAGTSDRLRCTARQAILASGLAYDSLATAGFSHVCTTASCGNGATEPGEQCDDANVLNGDGCSATCQLEGGACNDVCAGIIPVSGTSITSQLVASGLNSPLFVTAPPRDISRIFIVEQGGRIRIVKWGAMLPTPFLDISGQIVAGGEQGLLGLAFHPNYANNGRFFVYYTDTSGNTVVSGYTVSANPDIADTTESILLQVTQPFSNHNGGDLAFGPDGYLYIALGDGGSGGDPFGNGQNTNTLLGKLLRIDIDSASPYASPASNPFFGATPGRDEIWAFGLRNPWRYSFDRLNGDLYIADVGQNAWEEVNFQPALTSGGRNYGWNTMEATHCYSPSSGCNQTGLTVPILEYDHGQGCSITGGYVYRGCKMPDLRGTYFYSDFCSAFIRTFEVSGGVATNPQDRTADLDPGGSLSIGSVSSFGEDARGELYITDLNGGEVFKIVPGP